MNKIKSNNLYNDNNRSSWRVIPAEIIGKKLSLKTIFLFNIVFEIFAVIFFNENSYLNLIILKI